MFDFFKKKLKKAEIPDKKELSEAEKQEVSRLIAAKEQELELLLEGGCQEAPLLAKKYEELGVLQAALDREVAIAMIETSFSYQVSIGEGYKTLMNLYNQKRSEAAYKGDGEGIDKWMGKMDELRQIARNNTISS